MTAESDVPDFRSALSTVWPGETITISAPQPFGDGHSGLTYVFDVNSDSYQGELVARLSAPGARIAGPSDIGRQGRIMGALHTAGLPSPRVFVADSSGDFGGRSVAIMERVPGVGWEATARLYSDYRVAECAVDLLHQIRTVPVERTGLAGETPTSNAAEITRWSGLTSRCPDWLITPVTELASQLLRQVPPASGLGLVHGDYHYGNLLFDGEHPVAVLDWEIASLGDPLTDFGCLAVASMRRRYWPEPNPTGSVDISARQLTELYGVEQHLAAWHIAASCFKYSVIIGYNLQLHLRGKKLDPIYEELVGTARGLIQDGTKILQAGLGDY
jgi:aminoglycoside phosphotransferase (APT) family kinase protein